MKEKIDKTIESVCDAVQEMMENKVRKGEIVTEHSSMVSALAELIKANAEYKVADLKVKGPIDNYLSSRSSSDRIEL